MILWLMQAPPAQMESANSGPKIEALQKAQQWGALSDYFETLTPKERGANLSAWLQALQRAERWPRLLEVCDAVIPQLEAQSGPKLTIPRLERAQALSALNRHAEAEAAHEQNGKLGYADGFINACVEARNTQDWPGLERCSQQLLSIKHDNYQSLAWKGEAIARQGRYEEAEPFLHQAVEGDPQQALAWNNLGRCLNAKHAWAEAVTYLDKAVALDPAEWEARYNRGLAQFQLGHYEDSLKDLKAASLANPGDPQIRKDLASAESYVHGGAKPSRHAKSH
ncbi:MAG TPA: tetratricopeptide repeat protein [Holophagaceae bacterium]|jgi:tetratricopeptide (TPR) repeat protein|nr:tetratricopeptide repeat protein [Holophagaceae bacterium]